jgi:hypothetical protein
MMWIKIVKDSNNIIKVLLIMTAWAVNTKLENPVPPLPIVCAAAVALYPAKWFDVFTVVIWAGVILMVCVP